MTDHCQQFTQPLGEASNCHVYKDSYFNQQYIIQYLVPAVLRVNSDNYTANQYLLHADWCEAKVENIGITALHLLIEFQCNLQCGSSDLLCTLSAGLH